MAQNLLYTFRSPHNGESFHNFSQTPNPFFSLRPSKVLQTKLTHRSVYSVLWWVCDESVANMNPFGESVTFSCSFFSLRVCAILIHYRCRRRRRRAEDETLALTPHSVLLVVFGWKRLLWKQCLKHRTASSQKTTTRRWRRCFGGVKWNTEILRNHNHNKSHTISHNH